MMDLFHKIALEEYYAAIMEGKESDSEYVKGKVYDRYEREIQEEGGGR